MFLHDAQERTESWQLRHSPEAIRTLGVWRWKGIQANMELILRECAGKRVIDFGGSGGPLGLGSIVVDEKAEMKSIGEPIGAIDVIFTSHTLEHLDDPQAWLCFAWSRLNAAEGGALIVHVPSWTCERWRADCYQNRAQQPHRHTFCLWPGRWLPTEAGTALAPMVQKAGFRIEKAEYCGDDSIFVVARKL